MPPKARLRPTASNRKNQSEEVASSSRNVVVGPQEEEEREDIEVEADSEIDEASMKGPFPGGPENNELLIDYRHHVAYRIWNGK
ncbi:hypothetical protein QJS10_CPB20g00781 [Acorus calamus]|uniref:Uncharacterized protein n=1 Tax=Acorus calamus TaxID=4465 RepID=A0AAV9C9S6_ACOCL|nr:hypothetical protein QJS10_CPB20g00781 [Acorus calamus]